MFGFVDKVVYINLDSPYYYKPQGIYAIDVETNLRVVSRFKNATWESGIWTNGIFETGLWKGGIWYNGIFGEKAIRFRYHYPKVIRDRLSR